MRAMRVLRLVTHARTREPVLLLAEMDGDRFVPVFLRRPQADVIAAGPRTDSAMPPLTQDLLVPVVAQLGFPLEGVEITALVDGIFSAELVFGSGARFVARPSDVLALAVREGLPISMADAVLDEVGQPVSEVFPDGTAAPPEEQLREFREFLDDVSPEDFAGPTES